MKRNFDYLGFVKEIISFSPRQLEGEKRTANFIIDYLKKNKIPYFLETFLTKIPLIKKEVLFTDGKKIESRATSFVSGKIESKEYLVSSLIDSKYLLDHPNINFNPLCPKISLSDFYFAPALAVDKKGLLKILRAKKVFGEVEVEAKKHQSLNILVGNKISPKNIVFAHYDSIETGAIDNASGVAVMMVTILSQPKLLEKNLFVFSGNEELSYDKPTYWGHGFRVFEKKHQDLMEKARRLIIVDCLGYSQTKIYRDKELIYLAFPVKNQLKWKRKIFVLAGDIEELMSVYHSQIDDGRGLKLKYFKEATEKFLKILDVKFQ